MINLTEDGRVDEQGLVERAGMKSYFFFFFFFFFLKKKNDPANQPVFVHCQGGRHWTGTMTAVYRVTKDGWRSRSRVPRR